LRSTLLERALPGTFEAAIRQHDFARFHDLLEPPQIVSNLLGRLLAEQRRDGRSGFSTRRVVLQGDLDFRAPIGGRRSEVHRAFVLDVAAGQGTLHNQLARAFVDNLGIPLDLLTRRRLGDPV
jgi:hypothetical protein